MHCAPYLRRLISFLALCGALFASSAAARPPNIILILVDDLGPTDLSCTGSSFYETPQIDRLAGKGVKFTQAYSACTVCSPTRAAILTGKYPARLHLTDWIEGHKRPAAMLTPPDWTMYLPHEERTLAEALKEAGYRTASIGKWHLGREEHSPETHGFDLNLGGDHRGQPPSYFSPYKIPSLPDGPKGEFLTDREAEEAVRFIETNKERPFFLYLSHYAVHTPIQAKPGVIEKYKAKIRQEHPQKNAAYAALIESVDDSVGRILRKLDESDLAGNTVVIFTSDNSGLVPVTSNAPLRAGKGSAYEGGVRVPLLVFWPGMTVSGSTDSTPVISMDLYPTILEMAGVKPLPQQVIDGADLGPLLKNLGTVSRQALFWHYPHYHPGGATPYSAIREGDFKLLEFLEDGHVELFNLKQDVSETRNLANQMPWKANELKARLLAWRESTGAQMPLPNPGFQPGKQPWPSHVLRPEPSGMIALHARDVTIHGDTVRYESQPDKNTIGYWTKTADWVSWDFVVQTPGEYRVAIWQGCGPGNGGSEVAFAVDTRILAVTIAETKHFQDFLERDIGSMRFERPGRYRFSVTPMSKPGKAVMDLRLVTLTPVE
jgi:arylsulfatase A